MAKKRLNIIPAQDKRISWGARGLLYYMACFPMGKKIYMNDLVSEHDGQKKSRSALKELREAGYIHLKRDTSRKNGKMVGSYYVVDTILFPSRQRYFTKEWINLKEKILERDNHTCLNCGRKTHLHVHHLLYEEGKEVWEVPEWYLVTLCDSCHKREHSKKLKNPPKLFPNKLAKFRK